VLEPLASIARNCRHIVGIDTEVDSIDMVCIEGKRDRTRDHSGANAQLTAVRGDEHAGQSARQVRPNQADLDMTDWLSRGQQRGKDGSGVRLGCTVKVALEPAFVQRIPEERAAPLPVRFRCGDLRNETLKIAPLERAERDLGGLLFHIYPTAFFVLVTPISHALLTHDCGPHHAPYCWVGPMSTGPDTD
jgi:hypothetical protein